MPERERNAKKWRFHKSRKKIREMEQISYLTPALSPSHSPSFCWVQYYKTNIDRWLLSKVEAYSRRLKIDFSFQWQSKLKADFNIVMTKFSFYDQCDLIGLFGDKYYYKIGQNIWQLFGFYITCNVKTVVVISGATFGTNWTNVYSNIWSHWHWSQINFIIKVLT